MFRGRSTSSKTLWISSGVCLVLLAIAAFSVFGNPSRHDEDAKKWNPPISWKPKTLTQGISPGSSTNLTVSLVSSQNLSNVCLKVTRPLADIVGLTPTNIAALTKGQTVQVTISLHPPTTFPTKSVGGVIYAKAESKTHTKCEKDEDDDPSKFIGLPLPVIIRVAWATGQISDGNIDVSFSYPLDWTRSLESPSSTMLFSPLADIALVNGDAETPADITINLLDNSSALSLSDFLQQYRGGWYAAYIEQTAVTVDGIAALRFSDASAQLPSSPELAVFVPLGTKVLLVTGNSDNQSAFQNIIATLKLASK